MLKAGRDRSFPVPFLKSLVGNIQTFLSDTSIPAGTLFEINDFEPDNLKLEVKIGRKYRTIDLSNTNKLRYSIDIQDQISFHPDTGQPNWLNVFESMSQLLEECESAILNV